MTAATAAARSERSRELLFYECSSRHGGHELTLFANGTARLRRWAEERETGLELVELSPQETRDFVARLRVELDAGPTESGRGGVTGEGLEQCFLRIELDPSSVPERHRFVRLEAVSLGLARRIDIAEEILAMVVSRRRSSSFPPNYAPRPGDLLVRLDGERFRVVRYTSDGKGVEIVGVEQPLLLYVEAARVAQEFERLLAREGSE